MYINIPTRQFFKTLHTLTCITLHIYSFYLNRRSNKKRKKYKFNRFQCELAEKINHSYLDATLVLDRLSDTRNSFALKHTPKLDNNVHNTRPPRYYPKIPPYSISRVVRSKRSLIDSLVDRQRSETRPLSAEKNDRCTVTGDSGKEGG